MAQTLMFCCVSLLGIVPSTSPFTVSFFPWSFRASRVQATLAVQCPHGRRRGPNPRAVCFGQRGELATSRVPGASAPESIAQKHDQKEVERSYAQNEVVSLAKSPVLEANSRAVPPVRSE